MKKLLALILILAMVPVIALGADYSAMSDDDLWAEMKAIQAELWARSAAGEGVAIPAGDYIVGEDIPEGTYRLTFSKDSFDAILMITDNGPDSFKTFEVGAYVNCLEIGKLSLYNGAKIHLPFGCTCYTYTGLFN